MLLEFSFDRFLAAYDMLEDEVRHSTGVLVKKINPQAVQATLAELETQSRTRRLRAIGIATAMGAAPELEAAIVALIDDEDHVIRAEDARALAENQHAHGREVCKWCWPTAASWYKKRHR